MTAIHPELVHPRIRERREAVEGEARRVHNQAVWHLLAVCLLGVLGVVLLHSPLFDLERLAVEGWTGDPEVLALASGLEAGEPLYRSDIDSARDGIAALRTVESVSVKRSWNGTIGVVVAERRPVAALAVDDGRPLLVDERGRILGRGTSGGALLVQGVSLAGDTSAQVTWLDGPGTATARVAAQIPADMAAITRELQVNALGYSLRLDNGAAIRLGGPDELAEKFTSLRTLLVADRLRCAQLVDLRAAVSPVIEREVGCV